MIGVYRWKEAHPATSVSFAGERRLDVYTGIDLWGRNTFGGGGFDVYKVRRSVVIGVG